MTTRSLDSDLADLTNASGQAKGGTGSLPPMVSTRQKIIKKFLKHKLALMGMFMLIIMYFSIIFAEFLSPYGKNWREAIRATTNGQKADVRYRL